MQMRKKITFWACVAVSFAISYGLAGKFIPGSWHDGPPKRRDSRDFLAIYQDVGLDYYLFRFGLFGLDKTIRDADVICSSSSKGLYGFDPDLLSQQLSTADRQLKVFNLSFGFGEGFGYLAEVIKTLDLRDKVLVADLTDNTSHYHFTSMAQQAMQTNNRLDAYKLVSERWLAFERDYALHGKFPRLRFDTAKGYFVDTPLGNCVLCRAWQTGRIQDASPPILSPESGSYPFPFDRDGKIKSCLLDECARRNIQIIFTSIPYQGYDEAWGHRVAAELGYPHVTVDPSGIELKDPTHMAPGGRRLFSSRLGERLRETGACDAALRLAKQTTQGQN